MKVVFFHIPRTAGSSMWHSIANSYAGPGIHILDAYHQSQSSFDCEHHQQEILDYWLLDSQISNVIIHVHGKIDLKTRKDIDLVLAGTRKMFPWRSSYLSHSIVKIFYKKNKRVRAKRCKHQSNCKGKKLGFVVSFKESIEVFHSSLYNWNNLIYETGVKQNYKIIFYDESTKSKIDCANELEKFMKIDNQVPKFILNKYANNKELESRPETSHDSKGKIKLFGILLNILTLPFFVYKNRYFVLESIQKKIKKIF